jgi:hypothetical protein
VSQFQTRWLQPLTLAGVLAAGAAAGARAQAPGGADPALAGPATDGQDSVPVWGRVHADNACFVRMPDMPRDLYGGFGAVNPASGVVTFAGGAEKRTAENTITYFDLYALDLKSPAPSWATVPYGSNVGYSRQTDKGCREMAGARLPSVGGGARWLSVFGKDGCDNGAYDSSGKKGGDLRELNVGASATGSGVSWVASSGTSSLPDELKENKGRLVRAFAAYDTARNRLVFGQGTYDDEKAQATNDEVYVARASGSKWQVHQLRPAGPIPSPRYGSCAVYVADAEAGLDGVLVLGGQEGGTVGTTSHKEVWWLDFADREQGAWRDVTALFDNMDEFGFRREGACAYNPDTLHFYSWMGRADSKIPYGASHSAGVWRADLSGLGHALAGTGALHWERLAKDKLDGVAGRRLIPSVYDFSHNVLFALGGRNGLDEYGDTWAIFPDVTGPACDNLQVWTDVPTPEPTSPPMPTRTPAPGGGTVAPPTPTIDPGANLAVCDHIQALVPNAAVNAAISNPAGVYGYGTLCFPNRPGGPFNRMRNQLSLRNPAVPYHPAYNGLVWKCGCP